MAIFLFNKLLNKSFCVAIEQEAHLLQIELKWLPKNEKALELPTDKDLTVIFLPFLSSANFYHELSLLGRLPKRTKVFLIAENLEIIRLWQSNFDKKLAPSDLNEFYSTISLAQLKKEKINLGETYFNRLPWPIGYIYGVVTPQTKPEQLVDQIYTETRQTFAHNYQKIFPIPNNIELVWQSPDKGWNYILSCLWLFWKWENGENSLPERRKTFGLLPPQHWQKDFLDLLSLKLKVSKEKLISWLDWLSKACQIIFSEDIHSFISYLESHPVFISDQSFVELYSIIENHRQSLIPEQKIREHNDFLLKQAEHNFSILQNIVKKAQPIEKIQDISNKKLLFLSSDPFLARQIALKATDWLWLDLRHIYNAKLADSSFYKYGRYANEAWVGIDQNSASQLSKWLLAEDTKLQALQKQTSNAVNLVSDETDIASVIVWLCRQASGLWLGNDWLKELGQIWIKQKKLEFKSYWQGVKLETTHLQFGLVSDENDFQNLVIQLWPKLHYQYPTSPPASPTGFSSESIQVEIIESKDVWLIHTHNPNLIKVETLVQLFATFSHKPYFWLVTGSIQTITLRAIGSTAAPWIYLDHQLNGLAEFLLEWFG